jgi:hypothetical protein
MDKHSRYVRGVNILPKKEGRRLSGDLNGKKIIMSGGMGRGVQYKARYRVDRSVSSDSYVDSTYGPQQLAST